MRLVLATLEYPTEPYRAGGMCWAFGKIASGLKEMGHQVTVAVPADKDEFIADDSGNPVRRYRIRSMLPDRIEKALLWRFPIAVSRYNQAWSLYQTLAELEKEEHIDLVFAAAAPDSFFTAGSRRWKYVVRISAYWPLMNVSNYMPQKASSYFSDWMENLACTSSDARVAPSNHYCDIYESLGCGATRCIHTPIALISKVEAKPESDNRDPELPSRYILFYGSLQATKGTLILADALPQVLKAHPDLHVVFIGRDLTVAGLGSMAACITDKLSAYRDRVHIKGALEQAIGFTYIRHAEWVIQPSIMDNFPNTLLEAMYFARPVLVTRNSGTDDIIEDGVNGLVVNPNNVQDLAAGLEKALSMDEGNRRKLGTNARETVLRECDPAKSAKELESLLLSVSGNKNFARGGRVLIALRLMILRLRWAFQVARYYKGGTPRSAIRRLEKLCSRYLPGYTVTNI